MDVEPMPPAQATMLMTSDHVRIHALHRPAPIGRERSLAIVVVHGFTNRADTDKMLTIVARLHRHASVINVEMRGHGKSEGATSLGYREIADVSAAVRWARALGYRTVVTLGFSLGGAVVVRQAAHPEGDDDAVDALVSVSAPAFWYYKGTRITRALHRMVERKYGRAILRGMGARVDSTPWPIPMPDTPEQAASTIMIPALVVHGTVDQYFPTEHADRLRAAFATRSARSDAWIVEGFAHAESGIDTWLLDAITAWIIQAVGMSDGLEDHGLGDDSLQDDSMNTQVEP